MTDAMPTLVDRLHIAHAKLIADLVELEFVKEADAATETSIELEAAARIESLEAALRGARDAIASCPDETWGVNAMGDPDVPGGMMSWPIKDEILHYIDAALAQEKADG